MNLKWVSGLLLGFTVWCSQADPRVAALLTHADSPFVYEDSKGELTGYAVELVRHIQQQAGSQLPIQLLPWDTLQSRLQQEPNILAFSMVRMPEREERYHWITPITRNMHGLFVARPIDEKIGSLQQASVLASIGVERGDFREQLLKNAGLTNIVSFDSWPQAVTALAKGEIEAIFYSAAGLDYNCHRLILECSQIAGVFVHQEVSTYLVMSKGPGSQSLATAWRQAADAFKQTDAFKRLADAWLIHYQRQYHLPLHVADGTMNLWRLSDSSPSSFAH